MMFSGGLTPPLQWIENLINKLKNLRTKKLKN